MSDKQHETGDLFLVPNKRSEKTTYMILLVYNSARSMLSRIVLSDNEYGIVLPGATATLYTISLEDCKYLGNIRDFPKELIKDLRKGMF